MGVIAPRPGHLQADTVSHGGDCTLGEYLWSLTVTDERTGWTENQGFLGKYPRKVLPALQAAHEALPFELIAINVDYGSEFLAFPMTRSRVGR